MTTIYHQFAAALRSRLNGQFEPLLAAGGERLCLQAAMQAQVPAEELSAAAAEALGVERLASLADRPASSAFLAAVPIWFARRHRLLGLGGAGAMPVAMADLAQLGQLDVLGRLLGRPVRPVVAPGEEILRAINAAYQQLGGQAQHAIDQLAPALDLTEMDRAAGDEDLLDVATRAPVIKLVNLMLFEAVKRRASDVHVQPCEDRLVVRMRVDGVLHDVFTPPAALQPEILSRIKVLGGMNIAERRLAQDGRATVKVGERVVDLRLATLPTSFGERAVIRLLDKSVRLYRLGELGMPPGVLEPFRRQIRRDHGILLVTGPTGSGKSTTLYAALGEINSREMNILTLEDPIEYRLEGISQTQISERKGMTFASGLRHVLRQDPDIIMIGEIRDAQTASMAIQSALTGHLVFSTLHTNDAASAVARMLDLGVEPYLLATSLLGVLAQRLVRRICPHCRTPHEPDEAELRLWDMPREQLPAGLVRGVGCAECLQTGYRERAGIFELLTVDEAIRELIHHRAQASAIKTAAIAGGMTTLRADALNKAARGETTLAEVARTTSRE